MGLLDSSAIFIVAVDRMSVLISNDGLLIDLLYILLQ